MSYGYENQMSSNNGEKTLIVCYINPGKCYEVNRNSSQLIWMGVDIDIDSSGCDSHYVVTKQNGQPYANDSNYKGIKFNEWVVKDTKRILPLCAVTLKYQNS